MPPRRALITGISGQDGAYLAELLLADGMEVVGLVRGDREGIDPRVRVAYGDLLDGDSIRRAVLETAPTELYHLAAPTFVPDSWDDPTATVAAVAGGTATVLAAALALPTPPRIFVAASSEVFGDAGESPQSERSPMRPRSPYGAAKLCALHLCRTMREHHGLPVGVGITYNHESPRRPLRFLSRKVTAGAAAIAAGRAEELVLGDLDAVRDWSHARDVMEGAIAMVRAPEPGDYVLASGVGRTVRELVETAFAAAGVDPAGRVRVDPAFVRAPEPCPMVGDPTLARERLGWRARTTFEELIGEMVAADLALVGAA